MFPNTSNEENTGTKNQEGKGGTSSVALNYPMPLMERGAHAKNTTLVKHGHESIMDAIVATPLQERQPNGPMHEFGPCPILKETPEEHANDELP